MLTESLFFSMVLFVIGVVGVLTRRNAIITFMCVEMMLNAVVQLGDGSVRGTVGAGVALIAAFVAGLTSERTSRWRGRTWITR